MWLRSLLLPLAAALLAVAACDDDPVRTAGPPPQPTVFQQTGGGVGEIRFSAVWGSGAETALAIGVDHPLLRLQGDRWTPEPVPPGFPFLKSISGRSDDDIIAVGDRFIARWNGSEWTTSSLGQNIYFHDVWCTPDSLAYAAATDLNNGSGRVFMHNGTNWTPMSGRANFGLRAVWAETDQAVYAAGENGYAGRFNGLFWETLATASTAYNWLDAWGTGEHDAFFAGQDGHVATYHDGAFSIETLPAGADFSAVGGFAADDVWAVGERGAMAHFDGTAWTQLPPLTTSHLRTVQTFDDGRAVALGDNGTMLRFANDAWRADYNGLSVRWNDVMGFSESDVLFAGREGTGNGIVRHHDGREWTFPGHALNGLFGFAPDDAWAVGEDGFVAHFDGTDWTEQASGTLSSLYAATGADDGNARGVYLVGDRRTIRHWDGTRWAPMRPPGASIAPILAVWAASPLDVFAVSEAGDVLRYRGPAGSIAWTAEDPGLDGTWFTAMAGLAIDDLVAGTADGRLFRYTGEAWQPLRGSTRAPIVSIALTGPRTGVALSIPHTLVSLSGVRWHAEPIPYLGELRAIDTGGSPARIVGTNGSILEFQP
jgi:hypothetical protein